MASEPKGKMYVPVWVDAGIVKALISDTGTMPVTEGTPLTSIQAQLYGDMADTWYKVRVSSGRSLHTYITGQAGDVEVTQLNPADMLVGSHGYNGTAWKKQGMIWSYHSRIHAVVTHTQSGAGAYTMTVLTVPTGYVYVVNAISSNNATRALKHTQQLCSAGGCMNCYEKTTLAAGELVINANLNYVLTEDDTVKVVFTTSQDADYMVGRVWGYAMKVDM